MRNYKATEAQVPRSVILPSGGLRLLFGNRRVSERKVPYLHPVHSLCIALRGTVAAPHVDCAHESGNPLRRAFLGPAVPAGNAWTIVHSEEGRETMPSGPKMRTFHLRAQANKAPCASLSSETAAKGLRPGSNRPRGGQATGRRHGQAHPADPAQSTTRPASGFLCPRGGRTKKRWPFESRRIPSAKRTAREAAAAMF